MADERRHSVLDKPVAPNACPECKHTPRMTTRCFGVDIECLDERGRTVLCLCANDAHFQGAI